MGRHRLLPRRAVMLALALLPALVLADAKGDTEEKQTGGPYVPTPQVVVDEMLRMGQVGPRDFLVDLGSGDGVIVLTAAQRFKARGLGVDIDSDLVARSNYEAKRLGVSKLAEFRVEDVFKADIRRASVVTLYLLPEMMLNLRGKLLAELRPGTRVVSHDYTFGGWQPDDQYTWDVPEKEAINGTPQATVYLWIVPASVAGRWEVRSTAPTADRFELALRQQFQNIDGTVTGGLAQAIRLSLALLRGQEITFAFAAGNRRYVFAGRVDGDTMSGTVRLADGGSAGRWTASRLRP